MYLLFIISILIFVCTGIAVTWHTEAILKEDKKIIAVAEVYSSLDQLRLNLRTMITTHNYFILTSDNEYLVDYSRSKEELQSKLDYFRTTEYWLFMASDEVDSLELLIKEEVELMDRIIILHKQGNKGQANQLAVEKIYPLLSKIKLLAEDHTNNLESIQRSYKTKIEKDVFYINIILISGFCIGLLIILYTFFRLLVENRARRKSEKELLRYSEELKRINWSKDMFFSILAHDLRSPFISLLNLFELFNSALERNDLSLIKENIYSIEFSARRTFNLLQNLLEWSRLQTGRIQVAPEYFNIKDIAAENLDLYHEAARQKSILMKYSGTDIMVYADRNMISTVLRNLMGNAVKFTKKGAINIEAEKRDDFVIVRVIDSGIGLSEKDIEKLFKIEEDTRSIGTSREKGSGLGLILCRNFVELNNGRIWAESNSGGGSRFCFTIPVRSNN